MMRVLLVSTLISGAVSSAAVADDATFSLDSDSVLARFDQLKQFSENCTEFCPASKIEVFLFGKPFEAIRVELPDVTLDYIETGEIGTRSIIICESSNGVEENPKKKCYEIG